MPTPQQTRNQIDTIVVKLVELGLADDQNGSYLRQLGDGKVEVTFNAARLVSATMKDRPYEEIYTELFENRAYNVKMLDGALVQMMYDFDDERLQRHRLAFFPSPTLERFQSDPDIYFHDVMYAEIVKHNIVPFPFRFDYDTRPGVSVEIIHPKSHLTLGQYENCRIPVTAPLTPGWFIDFVLRNFYHTAHRTYAEKIACISEGFTESILAAERSVIHVVIPLGALS